LADPFCAIEVLASHGWARILTSGQKATALEGSDRLKALEEKGAGRINILPGGGIRASNATEILKRTGVGQLHASCLLPPENTEKAFGSAELLDVVALQELRRAMDRAVCWE
jgi:copper homeostasis protein